MMLEICMEVIIILLPLPLAEIYRFEGCTYIGKNRLIKMIFFGNIFGCENDVYNESIIV